MRRRSAEEDEGLFAAVTLRHLEEDQIAILIHLHYKYSVIYVEKGRNNAQSFDEVQKSYALFQTACENILDTYFPLLCDEDFLALQSEQ